MGATLGYSVVRARLRTSLNHRETLLGWFRMLRYALVQGPWRPWFIRLYQSHGHNPELAVNGDTLFAGLGAEDAAARLDRDAFAKGFTVPADVVDGIVAWSRETGAKRIDDPHLDCEGVQRIARDPRIVEVAKRYLEADPILFTSKIYWTIPPADAQGRLNAAAEKGLFHYDLADVKALTVFVYLTDVDAESGPHLVIRGTQKRRSLPEIFRRTISDAYAQRKWGDRIEVVTGERGTGWFEDITCYHKQAAGSKVRLMLSIIYSLHRRPIEDSAQRPKGSSDSRPADRMRKAAARSAAPTPA